MGVVKETIKPGDGTTFPQKGDQLTMTYIGTLASNGEQFDSSFRKGRPFKFTIGIGQVIRGWDEGVAQMSLGEKAVLKIASDYGYGARGAGTCFEGGAGQSTVARWTGHYLCKGKETTRQLSVLLWLLCGAASLDALSLTMRLKQQAVAHNSSLLFCFDFAFSIEQVE